MIIYNVTTKVELQIEDEWLQWMTKEHIPEVLQTGCFTDYKILRILDIDDTEGPTFAVQYFASSREDYEHYLTHHAPALRNKSVLKWRDRAMSFRSVMQVVK
jgi:hypothetical protein